MTAPGVTAQVTAANDHRGPGPGPRLVLSLTNGGTDAVTFTVAPNNYSGDRPRTFRVPAHGRAT